jgi:non-ribosomal peptide synthetase-like protein
LYGFHYGAHRAITRLSNLKLFPVLFGDSSYIVPYLRGLGYDFPQVVQTGSNLGLEVKQETPFLTSVGSGTMIADGLSVMNADFSNSSFRVSRVSIGPRNFLGNKIAYPSRGKTGDNCLLGTKVMVPIDGEIRENVGLLGSPCFEIPRSVLRDSRFDYMATGEELTRRLAAKDRYNLRTMVMFLLFRWMRVFGVTLIALAGVRAYARFGAPPVAVASVLILLFTAVHSVFLEQAVLKFRPLSPQVCSIYEPYFWWHERYWKVAADSTVRNIFNGTPFKVLFWRLAGVRIGRRVFDDGCDIPERSLVTIGDDCMLNAESVLQAHSQEDGTFKSDRIAIGAGCTLGVGALVHYGVTVGDGAVLEADSFLMKGSEVPPGARWGGNPAKEMVR